MEASFISIGESVHASIPNVGNAMKQLTTLGPDAYSAPSEPLDYIKDLIESQASQGADYIAVNVDAFGEDDSQIAVDMMIEYVKLVRKYSNNVPVCVDSSNYDVLMAGLKEWYNTDEKAKPPLLNSIKAHTMDKMLPLKKDYDYTFVGILTGQANIAQSIDNMYLLARNIFDAAVNKYGFKPEEIFYDPTVYPLAIDIPMQPGEASFTYKSFETMKKIKNDSEMKGVHITGGITNCVMDLPARRVGVMRAYVHRAMEYGLDSGIVNIKSRLHEGQPDPELLKLVDAYAQMNGSPEKVNHAIMLMGKFCQDSRKPA